MLLTRSKKPKLIAICVVIVIAAGIAVFMTHQQPKTIAGNAYTNPPMDSMGMMHFHPHLTLIIDTKPATVPANIGIDSQLFQDHSFDSNGMTGMAPLHTHDTSGTIHVESYKIRDYYLGQLLVIWGLDLSGYKQVTMTVNGQPFPDYQNYVFKDGDKVILSVNTK